MVRYKIIFFLLVLSNICFSQENESVVRKGLLRAQGTISFGKFSELDQNGLYLHGNLEYYVDSKISARGDIFYYLKPNDESFLELNHQLFSGASYHVNTNSNFNPYIGFQPGLAVTKFSNIIAQGITNFEPTTSATPLISGLFGFNYYANNWFHLFADARYVYGNHLSNLGATSIAEFRFSFGLGYRVYWGYRV